MASIQQSLNSMFAATLGATFAISHTPAVKNMIAVRDAKRSIRSIEDEAKAIHEKGGLSKDKSQLLSGAAARESAEMEKLASLAKTGEEAAKYRERAHYLEQASEGYQDLANRQKTRPERMLERTRADMAKRAAQRQAEAQRARAEVESAVEVRRAIIQGLSPERQDEIMKEAQDDKE